MTRSSFCLFPLWCRVILGEQPMGWLPTVGSSHLPALLLRNWSPKSITCTKLVHNLSAAIQFPIVQFEKLFLPWPFLNSEEGTVQWPWFLSKTRCLIPKITCMYMLNKDVLCTA